MDFLVMFKSLETIERRRSFRLASEELLVDQSTLNKRIKRLEQYYDTELVRREGKDIIITTQAKAMLYKYKEIESILRRVENEIMQIESYQIATTGDILLSTTISEHINKNIHVSNDYFQIISDFNDGLYREIILEDKFNDLIKYNQRELFTSIELGIIASSNIPLSITSEELFEKYHFVGNKNDPFNQALKYHFETEYNRSYEFIEFDCLQEVIAHIISHDDCITIVPSVLGLPSRLKEKVKLITIDDIKLKRRIYRYKR